MRSPGDGPEACPPRPPDGPVGLQWAAAAGHPGGGRRAEGKTPGCPAVQPPAQRRFEVPDREKADVLGLIASAGGDVVEKP
jgi:hypothetical protein